MAEQNNTPVATEKIKKMLERKKEKTKLSLRMCAHCTLCAESCFLFMTRGKDPKYMPSYKFINSIGKLYKEKGDVDRAALEKIGDIVWDDCVLCTRCYCPIGIDIPDMIALARSICRTQGVYRQYDK